MKSYPHSIRVISCACGLGAGVPGCELAPEALRQSPFTAKLPFTLDWGNTHHVNGQLRGMKAMPMVAEVCQSLAGDVYQTVKDQIPFLMLGGDQSCSVGTWSGAASALHEVQGRLGLVWIDAHMDAHTPETTESGNIHGMPLAALLGFGDKKLTQLFSAENKFSPSSVCLIGIRSYEQGEADLLRRLGVKIFFMEEVSARGIQSVLQEACSHVLQNATILGISLDVDGITPEDAPGVGTPVENGIDAVRLMKALTECTQQYPFIGAEIVEFNPTLDVDHKTERLVVDLINALYKG